MCGIAGILSKNAANINALRLQSMAVSLAHRGPDASGIWINENLNVGFAHRRLSIIDLSQAAAQPMHYANRYTIVHNGEIYNYLELKELLQKKGYSFQSQSDTEIILAMYDCYKTDCLQYFDGMFAFALWDEKEQTLFCARDRFGEKPFYYYQNESEFLFASEMKALWSAGVEKKINSTMMLNYLCIAQTQHPLQPEKTFYENIYSLCPATYLLYNLNSNSIQTNRYWDLDKQTTITITEQQAIETLEELFIQSIHKRLRSDVSIGTSLSGGIDSSSIVYYLISILNDAKHLKTFSAIFPGFENDESEKINLFKQQYQFKNIQVQPNEKFFLDTISKIIYHQEQPFTSSSIVVQYAVFQAAKENNCKVLLDGQGSDEILGGYSKYIHWYLQELIKFKQFKLQKEELLLFKNNNAAFKWNFKNKLAAYMPEFTSYQLQKRATQQILQNQQLNKNFIHTYFDKETIYKPIIEKLNDILYFDTMQSCLQQLLHNADRNSMAHGVEVRLPFLNHQLVEFIFSLPAWLKLKQGYRKWIWRKLMDKKLPDEITWQKNKIAFEPPQKTWMMNKQVIEIFHHSKEILFAKDIISKKTLEQPVQSHSAYEAQTMDWRMFMAGLFYSNNK